MNRDEIKAVLREVFGANTATVDHPLWVGIHCPLSRWLHVGGADRSPSAGVSVSDGGTSIFNCMTCKSKGPLSWAIRRYDALSGSDHEGLACELEDEEYLGAGLPEWGKQPVAEEVLDPPLSAEMYRELYDSAAGHPYLLKRGISGDAAEEMGLLFDPEDSRGEARILFPVYSYTGELHGFSGRAVRGGANPKVRDYHGLKKRLLLLGAHLIRPEDKYVIVVEGLFDYAKLVQYGFPVVAVMCSTLTDAQASILREMNRPVYSMYDADSAGAGGQKVLKRALSGYLPLWKVRYPERAIFDPQTGEPRLVKDPDELWESEVEKMIADARLL